MFPWLRGGRSVLVFRVAFLDNACRSHDVVGRRLSTCRLNGDAHRLSLPHRGLAHRDKVIGLWPLSDRLLDDCSTCSKLRDHGQKPTLRGLRRSAVGRIVAKPDHIGDYGIKLRQVQRRQVTGDPIRSLGPGCEVQRSSVSVGRRSLIRRARLTVKLRSVTSWSSPIVHSCWRVSM